MRQIKFRGWDERKQEYHKNPVAMSNDGMIRFNPETSVWFDTSFTPEQYTGLKDKNGKEIFEGDVVKAWHYEYEEFQTGVITIDGGTCKMAMINQPESTKKHGYTEFVRYWKDGIHDWYSMEQFGSDDLEVIGNIHETTLSHNLKETV